MNDKKKPPSTDLRFNAGLLYELQEVLVRAGYVPAGGRPEEPEQANHRASRCLVAALELVRAFEGEEAPHG